MELMGLIRLGPERVVFGSDAFGCDMKEHITFVRGMHLPLDWQQKILVDNAKKIYGF